MLCRQCEVLDLAIPTRGGMRRREPTPARVWGAERLGRLLCASCGAVPAILDVAQGLLLKHSQLAQFGLAGSEPLLRAAQPKDL